MAQRRKSARAAGRTAKARPRRERKAARKPAARAKAPAAKRAAGAAAEKHELAFMYFPEDYRWSHGMMLAIGGAPWGGGETDEANRVGQRLRGSLGDDRAWFAEWASMAEDLERKGRERATAGHDRSGAAYLFRAAHYYHIGERFLQPKTPEGLEAYRRGVACFKEAAHIAEAEGVTLALQDHHPVIRDHKDVLAMVAQVGSPAFKACLDVPLFPRQDDAWVREACQAAGSLQVHTHYNGEFMRDSSGKVVQKPLDFYKRGEVNYPGFVRELKKIGYTGYHCFEFCHEAFDDRWEPQGREYVDEQAALALEYLRDVMMAEGVYEK